MAQQLKPNRSDNRGGKRKGAGRPVNPPDYKTLQIRGVPTGIYKTLQSYCREEIEKHKKSVKIE